jgi:glutamate-1-semialdehyde 2,1-aminomutase
MIQKNRLENVLEVSGHPTWKFLNWKSTENYTVDEIKTYFMQEVFDKGLLVLSTHNVTLAHTPKILKQIAERYDFVFEKLNKALKGEKLREELRVSPLKSLFKVR